MKAYKCPKCGKIYHFSVFYCCDCNCLFDDDVEIVEIIDWEKELLTKTEEK